MGYLKSSHMKHKLFDTYIVEGVGVYCVKIQNTTYFRTYKSHTITLAGRMEMGLAMRTELVVRAFATMACKGAKTKILSETHRFCRALFWTYVGK